MSYFDDNEDRIIYGGARGGGKSVFKGRPLPDTTGFPAAPPWQPQAYTPEVVELARQLYAQNQSVAPTWEQMGDVTRSTWCDQAAAILDMS